MTSEVPTPGAEPAIAVRDLQKRYRGKVQAVAGATFAVPAGTVFGLLGPNGAGKSTTVRILATLTRPDGGLARVAGYDVTRDPEAVRARIGYVAQASGVDQFATGRENLVLQAQLERVPPGRLRARVDALLDWLDLTKVAGRQVRLYSGGMRRRLDIAMGLVHEPAVLFLDEPTTGLDPETRAALWRDIRQLRNDRGTTILLTTHYLEEADQLCDRLAIIDHGRVVIEGSPAALKAEIRGDAVTLEVNGAVAPAAALLHGREDVLEVWTEGAALIARVPQGATALPALVTALERGGIAVRSATLSRPSLDDVYLHHTGHRFAAGGEGAMKGRGRP